MADDRALTFPGTPSRRSVALGGPAGCAHGGRISHETDNDRIRRAQAAAWAVKLRRADTAPDDREAFAAWRRDPADARLWEALEAGRRGERFVVRPEAGRFKVIDIWTGETAVIVMTPQYGLSEADALHTAQLLNRRARNGDRSVFQ